MEYNLAFKGLMHSYISLPRRTKVDTKCMIANMWTIKIQINHQPEATIFQFIILMFIYSSTCFGSFPAHHQELNDCSGSLWFYLRIVVIVVLCSWSGWPDHEHSTTTTTI
jgi:hypothetical protein